MVQIIAAGAYRPWLFVLFLLTRNMPFPLLITRSSYIVSNDTTTDAGLNGFCCCYAIVYATLAIPVV